MSTFIAGQWIKCSTPDGSSSVVGTLESTGLVGEDSLDIRIMGAAYTFTDGAGALKPRWEAAVIEVLQPWRPYALVEAGHADVQRTMWIRLPSGIWRNTGSRMTADWFELTDPVIHFEGVQS
jgi:hypothetical protein